MKAHDAEWYDARGIVTRSDVHCAMIELRTRLAHEIKARRRAERIALIWEQCHPLCEPKDGCGMCDYLRGLK